jgi:hypothetical protein
MYTFLGPGTLRTVISAFRLFTDPTNDKVKVQPARAEARKYTGGEPGPG